MACCVILSSLTEWETSGNNTPNLGGSGRHKRLNGMNLSLNIYYSVARNGKDVDVPGQCQLCCFCGFQSLCITGVTTSLKCLSGHFAILSDGSQVVWCLRAALFSALHYWVLLLFYSIWESSIFFGNSLVGEWCQSRGSVQWLRQIVTVHEQ